MSTPPSLALLRAAHPRQALSVAAAVAAAAAVAGRPLREVALVAATVLVGQAIVGWAATLSDGRRSEPGRATGSPEEPRDADPLDRGNVWFALACAVLLVVPLAVANGRLAAAAYLTLVAVLAVGNRLLGATLLSFAPWVVAFALYPAFLAYGGWNGSGTTTPPTPVLVGLGAALGLGVHVLLALPGLVRDHALGRRSLPLRLALRTGTPRLLVIASTWTAVVVAAILIAGRTVGLT
jgi:hypothetical protein